MGCIYIIKNTVNDKVYIGQTIQALDARWRAHLYRARTSGNTKLYINMRKVGLNNFYIERIDEAYTVEELNRLEKYYIEMYDSIKNGYNTSEGGDRLESRLSEHTENILLDYICGFSSIDIAKIYKCSDETILNILKANCVEIRHNNELDILCIETGEHYKSYTDAARFIIDRGLSESSNLYTVSGAISRAVSKHTKAYSYTFVDNNDYINNGIVSIKDKNNIKKEENVITLLNMGYSYEDIASELGSTKDAIRMFCKRHNLISSNSTKLDYDAYLLCGDDFKIKFSTLKETAEWLIHTGIVDSNSIKGVSFRLGKAIKNDKYIYNIKVTKYNNENTYINSINKSKHNSNSRINRIYTIINGNKLEFKSATEAAKWLISSKLNKRHNRITDISYNIGISCKTGCSYENIQWYYM